MRVDAECNLVIAPATPGELRKYPVLAGNALVVSQRVLDEGRLVSAVVEALAPVEIKFPARQIDLDEVQRGSAEWMIQDGIVRVGTTVKRGTPLVVGRRRLNAEELVLLTILGEPAPEILLDCPLLDDGLVVQVNINRRDLPHSAEIELLVRRGLSVGDVLLVDGQQRLVVAAFSDRGRLARNKGEVDALLHPEAALWATEQLAKEPGRRTNRSISIRARKVTQQLEEKLSHRSIGAYSLLSGMPMQTPPTSATFIQAGPIAASGFVINARELLTTKSDALKERGPVYRSLVEGGEIPSWGASYSVDRLYRLLRACGFKSYYENSYFHIVRYSDEQTKSGSGGEVSNSGTIHYRSLTPSAGGLFCAAIFGTPSAYECACKKLRGERHCGETCSKCGVTVTTLEGRRERFGHVCLSSEVVHPWFIHTLPQFLRKSHDDVRALLDSKECIELAGRVVTGAQAIAGLLAENGHDPSPFIFSVLPVLPPDLRPIVPIGKHRFISSDLDGLYRRIIDSSNRLKKLAESRAHDVILRFETGVLQRAVELLMLTETTSRGLLPRMRGLDMEMSEVISKLFCRTVDFSAEAVCVPDASVPAGSLGVPEVILKEIFSPWLYRGLIDRGVAVTIRGARDILRANSMSPEASSALDEIVLGRPVLAVFGDRTGSFRVARRRSEAIHVNPQDASKFGLTFSGERISIHLPLSEEARGELLRLPAPRSDMTSALSTITVESVTDHCLRLAPLKLEPLDLLLLGASSA